MKNWRKRLRRLVRGFSSDPVRRTEHLAPADAARERGDWVEAASHYRSHLSQVPRDFNIWVQHGHASKEAGRLAEAEQSYARAHRLRPRDVDLLLHYANLRRMRYDYPGAAHLFRIAAGIDASPASIVGLGGADLASHITEDDRRLIDAVTGSALADRCRGVTLLNTADIVPLGGNRFQLTSARPWLEFRLDRVQDDLLGELTLAVASEVPERRLTGRLYVDYGSGYVEDHTIELPEAPDGRLVLNLVGMDRIRCLRWNLDDKSNVAVFAGLTFRPRADVDDALARVRAAYPDDAELEQDFSGIRRTLASSDITPDRAIAVARFMSASSNPLDYNFWLRRWVEPSPSDYARIKAMDASLPRRPTFSFVMPVYNPPVALLAECLDSLLAQTYADFEVCIADDRSPDADVRRLLARYAERDSRIKVTFRERNGHISAASNSALSLATGAFVVLVDHDDLVPDYALSVVAQFVNAHPDAQIFYSDEDKITVDGHRYSPYFKGEFDPFLMYGHNMVSHLGVYRRDLVERIGGFRRGLEGSQDYDLFLRAWEIVGDDAVVHIPHVLYHWRAIPGSTAVSADQKSYAFVAAQNAINGHFERTGMPLRSVDGFAPGVSAIKSSRDLDARVSIIIPTRDGFDDLKACIQSIEAFDHRHTEILIVDNGSEDPATLSYLAALEAAGTARVIRWPHPFNFSELNNVAAHEATGDILCFLNNDTEVLAPDWLDRARGLLAVQGVGIVGARLLYPDRTIQHFGVIAGMGAHRVAGHAHHGLPDGAGGYFGKARMVQEFSAVTAACLFISADIFRAMGGFDTALEVAYNDVDLCLKVRAAGHRVICDPEILLIHKESKSRGSDQSGAKADRLAREAGLMRERWADQLDHDPFYSPNHDRDHGFQLSNPPRVPMPWRSAAAISATNETAARSATKTPKQRARRKPTAA